MRIEVALQLITAALSLVAAVVDVYTRRIPNALTYSTIVAAIVGRTALEGAAGARSALLGGIVGGGVFFVFFLLHAMGAGDVKLITAIGCLLGPGKALEIVLATAIAGGVLGVAYAMWRRQLRSILANVGDLLRFHAAFKGAVHPTLNLSNAEAVRMPYAVPIAVGVAYTVWMGLR